MHLQFYRTILLLFCCATLFGAAAAQTAEKTEKLAVVATRYGDLVFYLYDDAPRHKSNFLKLIGEHFYDTTTFHRIEAKGVIEGGDPLSKDKDPTNDGKGEVGFKIPSEINWSHYHKRGALAMSATELKKNAKKESNGSQFYVVYGRTYTDEELNRIQEAEQALQLQLWGQMDYLQRGDNAWILEQKWEELAKQYPDTLTKLGARLDRDMRAAFAKEQTPFQFSMAARKAYKEVGGDPNRDNFNTVFGELIGGAAVLDKLAAAETKALEENGAKIVPVERVTMMVKVVELTPAQIKEQYGFNVPQPKKK